MATKTLLQVVSYIPADLKRRMEKDIRNSGTRITISAYIESVLRRHLEAKKDVAA